MRVIIDGIEPAHEGLIRIREERDEALAEVKRLRGELDDALAAGEETALDRDAATRALCDLRGEQFRSRLRALPEQLQHIARHDAMLHALIQVFARSPLMTLRGLRESYLERTAEAVRQLVEEDLWEMWFALWPADHFDDLTAISMASSLLRGAQDRYSARLYFVRPSLLRQFQGATVTVTSRHTALTEFHDQT